jgi:hypothetical protein
MTRRERLLATLRGEPVDRPAFNFYEINGLESTSPGDPFNIYSDSSWKPLLDLAAEKTDRIVMRGMAANCRNSHWPTTKPWGAAWKVVSSGTFGIMRSWMMTMSVPIGA